MAGRFNRIRLTFQAGCRRYIRLKSTYSPHKAIVALVVIALATIVESREPRN